MTDKRYLRTRNACFLTSFATAVTGNLSPLLFLTFRRMYGLSYTLLGLLVVINFGTQLLFDLIFSFFSDRFNLKKCLKMMPVIMTVGFAMFGLAPFVIPNHVYLGLAAGTVVFSCGSGLAEVLTSPTVSSIPADNPERQLSMLHSCYAWGVVVVVGSSTLYLRLLGTENWQWLWLVFALIPLIASLLFVGAEIPDMNGESEKGSAGGIFRRGVLWLCFFCIFLGGAAECTMSQWVSTYLEQALGIEKTVGDIFGAALFGAALGLGRSLYGKFGRNITTVLLAGSIGASVCYITAVLSTNPVLGLAACALTGFCVSMLWPGSLIATSDRIPDGGVAMYAFMASGGDLGASVCPQLVGIVADAVVANFASFEFAASMTADCLAMKAGLAVAAIFPLAAIVCFAVLKRIPTVKEK